MTEPLAPRPCHEWQSNCFAIGLAQSSCRVPRQVRRHSARLGHARQTPHDADEILFDDYVWDKEAHDFIDTFRKAGIETFVVTNKSTALMENLHWFAAEGCEMLGLCTITKKENRWGEETEEQIMGIRFKVN